jgi:hypothetical protein
MVEFLNRLRRLECGPEFEHDGVSPCGSFRGVRQIHVLITENRTHGFPVMSEPRPCTYV